MNFLIAVSFLQVKIFRYLIEKWNMIFFFVDIKVISNSPRKNLKKAKNIENIEIFYINSNLMQKFFIVTDCR